MRSTRGVFWFIAALALAVTVVSPLLDAAGIIPKSVGEAAFVVGVIVACSAVVAAVLMRHIAPVQESFRLGYEAGFMDGRRYGTPSEVVDLRARQERHA